MLDIEISPIMKTGILHDSTSVATGPYTHTHTLTHLNNADATFCRTD